MLEMKKPILLKITQCDSFHLEMGPVMLPFPHFIEPWHWSFGSKGAMIFKRAHWVFQGLSSQGVSFRSAAPDTGSLPGEGKATSSVSKLTNPVLLHCLGAELF